MTAASETITTPAPVETIETRASWMVATAALAVCAVSFGALKPIAADFGSARSVPALTYSLAWVGAAVGGLAMGPISERIGVRWTVMFGAVMVAAGLVLTSRSGPTGLYIGHGLFIGLLGNAGLNAPLYVYVSRWFDRRRGTALALISSGQSVAGAVWPPLFERAIASFGWRHTMLGFAVVEVALIVPVAALVFGAAPEAQQPIAGFADPRAGAPVLGLRPNVALGCLCVAGFLCCVPMAMPQGHLVAFCSDVGIPPTQGAAMLSVLLACAFFSRNMWGFIADRIGGLRTILCGSVCQVTALIGFLLTQNEAGLFAVSAFFGLGFAGIIPAYILAIRQLFPSSEAAWRIPTLLLFSGSGMAAGGWLAGFIFDRVGFYAAAFAVGIAVNFLHLAVIGTLVLRQRYLRGAAVDAGMAAE